MNNQQIRTQDYCYHVFYTKHINKKKKTYNQGILIFGPNSSKLYTSEGQLIHSFRNKTKERPVVDEEYVIDYKFLILIDKEGKIEDFLNGKIFIEQAPIPVQKPRPKNKNIKQTGSETQKISYVKLSSGLKLEQQLYEKLRQHQIQGINFMYTCVNGNKGVSVSGCILADYMGLGKTLQTLALIYSLLKSHQIKKAIVVCPLTLLTVWQKQISKWLLNKIHPLVCYGDNGKQNTQTIKNFVNNSYRMLVVSYQTFYRNMDLLSGRCDLIVFDEGHRLKNKKSKLILKMKVFRCPKRILLTGTPIQNNLDELYTCVSLINPQLFTSESLFKNIFEKPILLGMSKKATSQQRNIAKERTIELSNRLKQFSLRRNTSILEQYLPKKTQYLIFLQLTPLQKLWYKRIIELSKNRVSISSRADNEEFTTQKRKNNEMFRTLNQLRKLFTHPKILKLSKLNKGEGNEFLENCEDEMSHKIQLTLKIIKDKLQTTVPNNKIVVVSYYTETLDFLAQKFREKGISFARLDGRMKISDRKKSLMTFQHGQKSVLLLSGKAGGTGLTLTCATTMILLEPDWNPTNDSQIMGRVWRQGQQRQVQIYRLIIVCSFEEKMLQRQGIKNSLAASLIDNKQGNSGEVDYQSLGHLFVDNRDRVLSYAEEENDIQTFMDNHPSLDDKETKNSQGIIFIKQKCSHTKDGTFQGSKESTNQFQNPILYRIDEKSEETTSQQEEKQQVETVGRQSEEDLQKQFESIGQIQAEKLESVVASKIPDVNTQQINQKSEQNPKNQNQAFQQNQDQSSEEKSEVIRFKGRKKQTEEITSKERPMNRILGKIKKNNINNRDDYLQ